MEVRGRGRGGNEWPIQWDPSVPPTSDSTIRSPTPSPPSGQRPLLDGEGLRHGRPPGRAACSSASGWASTPTATSSTGMPACPAAPSRSPCGAAAPVPRPDETAVGPIRYEVLEPMKRVRFTLDPNAVPTTVLRLDLRVGPATGHRGSHPPAGAARLPGQRRSGPLPPDRDGLGLGRDRRRARRDRPRTSGCPPATTRGASATTSATPPTDVDPFNPVAGHGLPDDLVPGAHGRPGRHPVGAVHAPGRCQWLRSSPADGDRRDRAPRRTRRAHGRHPTRPGLRPGQPASARRHGVGHPGRRLGADVRPRGAHRHRVPPGGRPLLRMAGPPSWRVARRAPWSTGNGSRTAAGRRWPASSTSSGTPSSTSASRTPGPRGGAIVSR